MSSLRLWSVSARTVGGIIVAGIVTVLLVFASAPLTESEMVSFDFPPEVITNPATDITESGATLQGTVNDLGSAASVVVSFEWGTDEGFANETNLQGLLTPGTFSAKVMNLEPDTIYYFRAKVEGSEIKYGEGLSFTTM